MEEVVNMVLTKLCLQGWCWVCGYGRGSIHSLSGKIGLLCPNCFYLFFNQKLGLRLIPAFLLRVCNSMLMQLVPTKTLGPESLMSFLGW